MRKIFFVVLFVFFFFPLVPYSVRAQGICGGEIIPCGKETPCTFCHIFEIIYNIIDYLITCIAPVITVLAIVVGGSTFIMATTPEAVGRGKSILTSAVLGFMFIMMSWLLLNTFLEFMGATSWEGIGNWWDVNCP